MEGSKKFQEMGQKLKAEVAAKEELELANKEAVVNQLAQIQGNADLAAFYNNSAKIGAENLGGTSPYLKVHAAGKSTTNFLADGKKPNDGWFFYAPTQEQFETVDVHILTISGGFRAESKPDDEGKTRMVYNQIMAGVLKDGFQPFLMYMTGKKLQPMWDFGKEASKYTKAKPVAIPMFLMTVTLSTEESENTNGKGGYSWIVNFKINKTAEGNPVLVDNIEEATFLRDLAIELDEQVTKMAKSRAREGEEIVTPLPVREEPYNGEIPMPDEGF